MADTRPTKLKFTKIVYLCFLSILSPKKFVQEEDKDNEIRKGFPPEGEKPHRIYSVTKAFWKSLVFIIVSAVSGVLVGLVLKFLTSSPSDTSISIFQIIGACLLLWGTIFIRGWEIQTYCGVTLTERVNQWLYRGLYCLGTSIIVLSIVWS